MVIGFGVVVSGIARLGIWYSLRNSAVVVLQLVDKPALSLPPQTVFLLLLDGAIVFTVIIAAILTGKVISGQARAALAAIGIVFIGAALVMIDSFAAIDSYNRDRALYIKLAPPPSLNFSEIPKGSLGDTPLCQCHSIKYKDRENHVETNCDPLNCDGQHPAH
jgi:hypothetical protein